LLSPSQFGFQKNISTELAILQIQDKIAKSLAEKQYCIGIFLDIAKAFDTINHSILLEKLKHYGIRGIAHKWFHSYLKDRVQFISYNNILSSRVTINCGVPQGSILGPILFILYMNDITTVNNRMDIILFADDTNCLFTGPDLDSVVSEINTSLQIISNWFKTNQLSLNINKTSMIHFHRPRQNIQDPHPDIKIDNQTIIPEDTVKFLGIYLDSKLTWKAHLISKANQIARVNAILSKLKHQLPVHILKTIYTSLILPHIQYSITAWGNLKSPQIKRIKILQKHSIRLICNSKFISHTAPLFKKMKLLTIDDLYEISCCKLYHKNLKGCLPQYFSHELETVASTHQHHTRQHSHIYIKNVPHQLANQTINHRIATSWNKLPDSITNSIHLSSHSFSRKLKHLLLDKYPLLCNKPNCYVCSINT
jgi:hypothetical protein